MENRRSRRVSTAQWEQMIEFLEMNPSLLRGYNNTSRGRAHAAKLWGILSEELNAEDSGTTKTPKEWAIYVSNHKSKLKKVVADLNADADGTGGGPPRASPLSEIDKQFLAILGPGFPQVRVNPLPDMVDSADENTAPGSFATPQPKSRSYFQKVRTRCVALIVKHGRPAELLDDTAFKDILNLIPMTKVERSKLSSEAIREYMESTDAAEARSCDESRDNDQDDEDYVVEDDMETENVTLKRKVKNELGDCDCPTRDTGTHEEGCQAIAREIYWQYFEVSIDEATCKLCRNVIKWSSMSDLKVHLTINHPSVTFKDDDDEFTTDRGRLDSEGGGSIPERTMEEVYLEEDLFLPSKPPPAPPSSAKKRKYAPGAVVTLKDNESIGIERFKSLDRFGLYVASLMKLLPVEKSLKYQEQIIQRLIREQAAAG